MRGRYVLLLNPDVEIDSGTFDELVADARRAARDRRGERRAERSRRRSAVLRSALPLALAGARRGARGGPLDAAARLARGGATTARYGSETSADWLVGAFLIARAEALAEVGPLDERFFLYSEETDWCFRFHRAGWGVSHLPTMTVTHHTGHAPGPDLTAQQSYAKILFARKHYGWVRSSAIRAALVLRHALRAAPGILLGAAGVVRKDRRRAPRAGRRAGPLSTAVRPRSGIRIRVSPRIRVASRSRVRPRIRVASRSRVA